jgi:cell division protease FtsH
MKLFKNVYLVAALACVTLGLTLLSIFHFRTPSKEITRTELQQLIESKGIIRGTVTPTAFAGIYEIEGERKVGARNEKILIADSKTRGAAPAGRKVATRTERIFISTHLDEAQVQTLLAQVGTKIEIPGQNLRGQWVNIVSTLIFGGLVIAVMLHQMRIGKGKNTHVRHRPMVAFRDVAGIEEAKGEVQEIVDFLRDPKKYQRLGGSLPKGVLLIGPPGTGKTMLAKAIASEANASFFCAHGSDFAECFVGVGAKRVRQLFRQAARHKPAIIFIDEIDCVGKSRKFETNGEHQQTINALLTAMDGFESSQGIIVVAATNRPEDLDDALLRPGRFDRKVHVPYPDMKGRRAILQAHAEGKPISEEAQALDVIAQTTPGMSGADLANLLNEAAIFSALQNGNTITLKDLEGARDKVRFGQERKSMVLKQKEREMVAYHEAGHTIIHLQTHLMPPLYKVSIVPRGNALGVTTLLPDEDQNLQSKKFLLEELLVLMGGRAAEKAFYDSTTNGAAGDLDMARKVARKMIHEWGMGEKLYYEPDQRHAEDEINRLLETADRQALELIQTHRDKTKKLAQALLEKETLTREEVLTLLEVKESESSLVVTA